jgi:hypothetical protein
MEYRSNVRLFGLPLVHVAIGGSAPSRRGVATGWIAIGDVAIGVLFAFGGAAFGSVSLGGFAFGLVPIGGLALGLLALGGVGIGVIACGGAAFAAHLAVGGLAIARDYAMGGLARAQTVLGPTSSGRPPFSAIPHPTFRVSDALLLAAFVVLLASIARSVYERRAAG